MARSIWICVVVVLLPKPGSTWLGELVILSLKSCYSDCMFVSYGTISIYYVFWCFGTKYRSLLVWTMVISYDILRFLAYMENCISIGVVDIVLVLCSYFDFHQSDPCWTLWYVLLETYEPCIVTSINGPTTKPC